MKENKELRKQGAHIPTYARAALWLRFTRTA